MTLHAHIIGQEFQAVFLSTTEAVDDLGNACNPTKSPCDRYVFNTVLTRAKALVVVVGSPLALLKIEDHMIKRYGGKGRCWSVYLKSCLEKNTFEIPKIVEGNTQKRQQFKAQLATRLGITAKPSNVVPPVTDKLTNKMSSSATKMRSVDPNTHNKPSQVVHPSVTSTNSPSKPLMNPTKITIPGTATKVSPHPQSHCGVGAHVKKTEPQQTARPTVEAKHKAKSKSVPMQRLSQLKQGNP